MNGYTEEQKDKLRGPRMNDELLHATEGFTYEAVIGWILLMLVILINAVFLAWFIFEHILS